jgi:hypothetical protein
VYLKITDLEENHHGLQYHDGLVEDIIPFIREGSCVPGGIYFTVPEHICKFLGFGIWIREVTIPEDAEMVKDPQGDKWRANKVILGERKDLSKVETWRWLVEECKVDIHSYYTVASVQINKYLEIIKYLVEECKVNIHSCDEFELRYAFLYGSFEVVKYLVEECECNVNVFSEEELILAYSYIQLEKVKYLEDMKRKVNYGKAKEE